MNKHKTLTARGHQQLLAKRPMLTLGQAKKLQANHREEMRIMAQSKRVSDLEAA